MRYILQGSQNHIKIFGPALESHGRFFLQEVEALMPTVHLLYLRVVVRRSDSGQRATSAIVSRQGFASTMLEKPASAHGWSTEPDNAIASTACVSLDLVIL